MGSRRGQGVYVGDGAGRADEGGGLEGGLDDGVLLVERGQNDERLGMVSLWYRRGALVEVGAMKVVIVVEEL